MDPSPPRLARYLLIGSVSAVVFSIIAWMANRRRRVVSMEEDDKEAIIGMQRRMHLRWLAALRDDAATSVLRSRPELQDLYLEVQAAQSHHEKMQAVHRVNSFRTDQHTSLIEIEFNRCLDKQIPTVALQKALVQIASAEQKAAMRKALSLVEEKQDSKAASEHVTVYEAVRQQLSTAQKTQLEESIEIIKCQLYRDLKGSLHEDAHIQISIVKQAVAEALQSIGTEEEISSFGELMKDIGTTPGSGNYHMILTSIEAFINDVSTTRADAHRDALMKALEQFTLRVQSEYEHKYTFFC